MSVQVQVDGLEELVKTIKQLKKIPQRSVTRAARLGAKEILKAAKTLAPIKTGALRSSIILKGEKLRKKGKKVYQVVLDPKMKDLFVKISKNGKSRYHYGNLMEYGYVSKSGKKIQGRHFLRRATDNNVAVVSKRIVEVLTKEIDKLR